MSLIFIVSGKSFNWEHLSRMNNIELHIKVATSGAAAYSDPGAYLNRGVRQFLEFAVAQSAAVSRQTLLDFRSHVESMGQGANTKYCLFSNARGHVARLQAANGVCRFVLPKNLPRDAAVHKENLYELAPTGIVDLSEAQRELVNALQSYCELDEIGRCAVVVAQERMEAIARHACREIEEISCHFGSAQTALASAEVIPLTFRGMSASLNEAIRWAHSHYGRLMPSSQEIDLKLYRSIKLRFGGLPMFQTYLGPTSDSLAPFLALFLADSFCQPNVDDVWNYTFRDCVVKGASNSSAIVRFGKLRGSAQEFGVEVPDDAAKGWNLASALRFLNEYTGSCLTLTDKSGKDNYEDGRTRLFLHLDRIANKSLKPLDPGTVIDCLRRFLQRAATSEPSLRDIAKVATGENFRPTHAFISVSKKGIFEARRRLRHAFISTTQSYTDRIHVRSSRAIRIVSFQDYLYKNALNLAPESASDAIPTGLGLHCSAQRGGNAESADRNTEPCWRPDLCDDECASTKLVLEEPKTVSIWMKMSEHLENQRAQMTRDYPQRWNEVWAPRLIWYSTLIAKTSARVRKQATELCRTTDWSPPSLT